jgi:hypothetical protein
MVKALARGDVDELATAPASTVHASIVAVERNPAGRRR